MNSLNNNNKIGNEIEDENAALQLQLQRKGKSFTFSLRVHK